MNRLKLSRPEYELTASQIIEHFKQWGCKTPLAGLWHRWVPSFVVQRRFYGARVYLNLRDNIDYITKPQAALEKWEDNILMFPRHINGTIWDVGANIGLFSVRASQLHRHCVAFELSPRACKLMRLTKKHNLLDFIIVERPLTVESRSYIPPDSASAENRIVFDEHSRFRTLTYLEAQDLYGLPSFIKMDIEGGELEFFNSLHFKSWLLDNSIIWLVEVHRKKVPNIPLWKDVPHYIIDPDHYLYYGDTVAGDKLAESIKKQLSVSPKNR